MDLLFQLPCGMWTVNWTFLMFLFAILYFRKEEDTWTGFAAAQSDTLLFLNLIFIQLLFLLLLRGAIKVDHAVNWDELVQRSPLSH